MIVKKRQRRLDGIDEIVLSLTARGLATGEVTAHFDGVYGAKVSRDTISRITVKVCEEMIEWQNRPLDAVYPVLFVDAIYLKVRDGQVTNRPFFVVVGVTVDGRRDGRILRVVATLLFRSLPGRRWRRRWLIRGACGEGC